MQDRSTAEALFFTQTEMDSTRVQKQIENALHSMDDGELYLEFCQSESLSFDDGRLRNANFDTTQGFGLRSVLGETTGYAHSSELSEAAIARAANTVRAVNFGQDGSVDLSPAPFGSNQSLYSAINPLGEIEFSAKVKVLEEIDAYLRKKDARVRQVSASIAGEWQVVHIMKADGRVASDIRPLVRLNVTAAVEQGDTMETGSNGAGARTSYSEYLQPENWKKQADEALRQALVNLDAKPAPAGEMPVVLGNGWCGVLLHEAIGHGLEGDFNRKETSAFSGLLGERVASKGVTIVDDGTLKNRRGSLTIDDEGTPTSNTVLIEDGILKGFMQDRLNARLMNVKATGNGRRESYAHQPMPRMTNTYMLGGDQEPQELVSQIKRGLYAKTLGGGQVDITSGKFVFAVTEAYMVENGKILYPVKGATLIGNGPDALTKVTGIGNDAALDDGIGTCGKAGQGVPVGVGQPSMLISEMTVGGTEL
ncbi:MAG: metalloprotease TldD [Alphaproteobacteria bacterium]|nr:metalloprotease TldD [Alphaproteobacteria bacterium]